TWSVGTSVFKLAFERELPRLRRRSVEPRRSAGTLAAHVRWVRDLRGRPVLRAHCRRHTLLQGRRFESSRFRSAGDEAIPAVRRGREVMKYYQVPADLLDDPDALRPWAETSIAVAGTKPKVKRKRR